MALTSGGQRDSMINSLVRMSEHPLASIVVLNWNGKGMLRTCLQSLSNLTYPDYEIIVVDNASTDGSPEMVTREFPSAKVIVNEENLGFAAGCNVGIRVSKGKMIALFNNDAIAEPAWLTKLVEAMTSCPEIGVASGITLLPPPGDFVWSAGQEIDPLTGETWRLGYGNRLSSLNVVDDIDYLSGCALLLKRETMNRIGLLDEGFFLCGEDLDWNFSAKRAGYECKLVPGAIVWHMDSASRRKIPLTAHYYFVRGRLRVCFKHFPIRYLATSLVFQCIVFPFFEIVLFKRSAFYVLQRMKALAWNLQKLRDTMKERRRVETLGDLKLKCRLAEFLTVAKGYNQRTIN
jgi:GT2 family glycosyltransferase